MNPKGQHFVKTIKNSSNHLLNIINDILDVAALKVRTWATGRKGEGRRAWSPHGLVVVVPVTVSRLAARFGHFKGALIISSFHACISQNTLPTGAARGLQNFLSLIL